MTSEPNSLIPCELSEKKRNVAAYLRDGWSRQAAADAAGVDWSTVQRWATQDEAFRAYVRELQDEMLGNQAQRFAKLVESWQSILQEVADGKREPNDRLARHAEKQLSLTLYRVYVARAGGVVAR